MVMKSAGVTQIFVSYSADNARRMFFRNFYGGGWSPWSMMYDSNAKPTPNEIGAASVNCNFAGALGTNRNVGGANKPTTAGVWTAVNNTWTPQMYGSIIVTTNRQDETLTSTTGSFIHYLFISHYQAKMWTATDVNGTFSGWRAVMQTSTLTYEDLNAIVNFGFYDQNLSTNATLARNYPVASAGSLVVKQGAGIIQEYHVFNSSQIWTRAKASTASEWTTWQREFNTEYPPSFSQVTDKPSVYPPEVHTHPWSQLTEVPLTFPPAGHTHPWDQITGKPSTFAPSAHTHTWDQVTSKPTTFPPSSHTHPWSEVTGAPATATRWPAWSEVTSKPTTFAPSEHTHPAAQGNADIVASGWGQIGTYAMACCIANVGNRSAGFVTAGSNLKLACGSDQWAGRGDTLPGTWKLLGYIHGDGKDGGWNNSTWIRIS